MHAKFVPFFFLLCLGFAVGMVEAAIPVYQIDAVHGSTPTIDGVIAVGEWTDVSPIPFNDATVYVKQDGRSLYVAFSVADITVSWGNDGIAIGIDTNHDGGSILGSDDFLFAVYRNGSRRESQDGHYSITPSGWTVAATSNSTSGWRAEFNITYSKVGIVSGSPKTLGLMLTYNDEPISYYWPPASGGEAPTPSLWGELASTSNWIPEFPSLLALPILVVLTLLATIAYKRRTLSMQARSEKS